MIFHFHYNMPKVVKCGNSGPENVPVYLEDLRNSRIGLVQHHVTIIFGKIREGSLTWKKLRGCLSASVSQELTFNILYLRNPNVSLTVCNLPYYRHPSVCCGQQVLGKFPVNSALCHVYSGCFVVNIQGGA